jgi:hypothetical protein
MDAIPTRDQDMMHLINNPPGFSDNLSSVFGRYDRLGIQSGRIGQDVFGLGQDYDNTALFYRRLINEATGGQKNAQLNKSLENLSYTNQLLMESGNLDPVTYYLMNSNVRKELSKLGLDRAEIMGIEGGETAPINIHKEGSGLSVLASDRGGVSINPQKMMTDYNISMIRKYIRQGQELKKYDKAERSWDDIEKELEATGFCKPSAT